MSAGKGARVGLVGGLGPESTIDYYRRIVESWPAGHPSGAPSILIDSLDVTLALRLVAEDRAALVAYLDASVRRLAAAGATFVAITANTPHIVFAELAARAPLPLLSIVEACADEAERAGRRRLLLLGTRFTMEAGFYPAVFAARGMAIVVPAEAERGRLHARYVDELLRGDFKDATRGEVVALVERLRRDERVDAVILGGTELPLLLGDRDIAGLPVLDTTAIHVRAIVQRLLGDA